MSSMKPLLKVMREKMSICRMPADSLVPMSVFESDFFSITRTSDELSIVCGDVYIPADVKRESDFRVIKVDAKLDFSLVGIIAGISAILAEKEISIFVVSTYDTDYILVRASALDAAVNALTHAGHDVKRA